MPDKIDKLRTKVRKACDNCRKRKLRCTGKQPCSTCEAYSCPCIYSARSITNRRGRAKKNKNVVQQQDNGINTSSNAISSIGYEDISRDENSRELPPPTSVPYMTASNIMHLPESIITNSNNNNNDSNSNNINASENLSDIRKSPSIGNIPKYTQVTGYMTQVPPVIEGNDQLYQDDTALQMKLNSLQSALDSLRQITVQEPSITKSIETISEQIDDLVNNWKPRLNLPLFKDVSKEKQLDPNKQKSLESSMLKNKYTDRVCLTRFAIWSDSSKNNKLSNSITTNNSTTITVANGTNATNATNANTTTVKNNKPQQRISTQFEVEEPLITEMFGLYSPFQAISFRGIGYVCLDHIRKNNGQIKRHVKETLYLILRYFDMCFIQLNEGKSLIANPLDNYSNKKSLASGTTPGSPDAPVMTFSPGGPSKGFNNTAFSGSGPGPGPGPGSTAGSAASSGKRNTISQFIRMFAQPFVYEISGITTDMLLDNITDSLTMFQMLLKIFNGFQIAYESFMVEMTSSSLRLENKIPTFTNHTIQQILNFSEVEQLLFPLCYQYYNETQFLYYKSPQSIDYLELSLSLVDEQLACYDYYSATLVMDAAVNRALKMGLYRWEYYVGLDEANAERRRKIWWGLYYFDKLISVTLGEPSTINYSIMSCFLPAVFRDIGFLDSKTFVKNVHLFNLDSRLFDDENMDISTLVHYGRIGIIQLVSDFQINVLYNEKYTSVRNTAVPPLVKSRLFQEVVTEYDLLRSKLQALRNHCSRLFELASTTRNENGEAVLNGKIYKNDDINAASRFTCSFEYHFSVVLSTIDNLEARLSSPPYTNPQFSAVADIFHEIYYSWNRMNLFLRNFTNDYSFTKIFMYFRCVTILFITKSDVLKAMITRDDLRSMVLALHKYRCLWILTLNEGYPQVRESSLYREYCKNISFLCLGCRILTHQYLNQHSITADELTKWFQQNCPELVDTFKSCVDISSPIYKYLLMPVQRSGFHLHVRRMLESNFLRIPKQKSSSAPGTIHNNKNKHPTSKSEPANMHPPMTFSSPLTQTTTRHGSFPSSMSSAGIPVPATGYRGAAPVSNLITSDMYAPAYVGPQVPSNPAGIPPHGHSSMGFSANNQNGNPGMVQNSGNNDGQGNSMFPFAENGNPSDVYMQNKGTFQPTINDPRSMAQSFNLGTLDEFVNSDIGSIYNILWNDLYSDTDKRNQGI
ncbi:transcription factor [Maudiozyma exigua]|uniref:Transcription factor n=1 Tax=Maudiozyma exigua TaxID=34358 RepID=A0A9P6W303_MAUEX|nr:transcription factor [Kazachstania exigua]